MDVTHTHFIAMGGNSGVGGFSAYVKFLDEQFKGDSRITIYGELNHGLISKNKTLFFPSARRMKKDITFYVLTFLNYIIFNLLILKFYVFNRNDYVWVQITTLKRNPLPFKSIIYNKLKLIVDVRDTLNLEYVKNVNPRYIISCGIEINNALQYLQVPIFDITTPISSEDLNTLREIAGSDYVIFAHGIQEDKGLEDLKGSIKFCVSQGYRVVIAGRERAKQQYVNEIVGTKGVDFLGPVSKATLLFLLKGSAGLILFSKTEGVSRVALEAIELGTMVYCAHPYAELQQVKLVKSLQELDQSPKKSAPYSATRKTDNCLQKLMRAIHDE